MEAFLNIIGYIFAVIVFLSFFVVIAAVFVVGAGTEKSNDDYYE
jgi:hypothetical protein